MFDSLRSMGHPYGVKFNPITMMPNTNKALQLAEYAKTIGKSKVFNDKVFEATFVEDVNISSEAALLKIANSVGIGQEAVESVLASGTYKAILEENKHYCQMNRITSVPTFIINGETFVVGAQGIDRFRTILEGLKK